MPDSGVRSLRTVPSLLHAQDRQRARSRLGDREQVLRVGDYRQRRIESRDIADEGVEAERLAAVPDVRTKGPSPHSLELRAQAHLYTS